MWCKGVNIGQRQLITSDMNIRNNSNVLVYGDQTTKYTAGPNRMWDLCHDSGVNVIQICGDQGINCTYIDVNASTYWEQNFNKILNKAETYNMKITIHWMGTDGAGGTVGLTPPYTNNSPNPVYLTIAQGQALLDKLGGNNDLSQNFISDSRIAWWPVINEAPIAPAGSYGYVLDWCKAMCLKIKSYGGKASAVVRANGWPGYPDPTGSFGEVPTLLGPTYVDYIHQHNYLHSFIRLHQSDSPDDFYDAVYNEWIEVFTNNRASRGAFSPDQIINSELSCGNGTWYGAVDGQGAITTTQCQQTQYIEALSDALNSNVGIGGFCWHSPVEHFVSYPRQYGYIEYNGTVDNTVCSPTPDPPLSILGPYDTFKSISGINPEPVGLPFHEDFDTDLSHWTIINGTWSLI